MNKIKAFTRWLDKQQRSYLVLAFPLAVIKRYSDDKAGRQAALLTYYAFLAIFPLLLIFLTVLGILAGSHPHLQAVAANHIYQLFPDLEDNLKNNVHTLRSSGLALILQALVLLYGARGLATILQETFNNLWHIAPEHRPGFWGDHLRSLGMMLAVGLGILIGTAISVGLSSVGHIGLIGTLFITLVNLSITYGLFLAVFRLGTSDRISLRKLVIGAVIATIGMVLIQRFGSSIMSHQLPKLQGSYGSFAIALGLLFWIYLQAQVILYAIVITIVRTEHDWPKDLF